ncbi:dynamin family protein [Lysinibacillus sp. BW-2-10]|uniref:dynamin family protein n=1 Tax=Lysinibacillus sp. BW-2-10 TaxID=2590030 RepID=UPI00117D5596|nr:dynamin family protein [Lysinibacillus sp. BW-2-10]TSI05080.1 hypothetical protein FJQ64_12235 [Lysinibacillus sp. BW-2-10]
MVSCQECFEKIEEYSYFCKNCGTFTNKSSIENDELKKLYQNKMKTFINKVQNENGNETKVLWNETINRYVQTLTKMQSIVSHPEVKDTIRTNTSLITNITNYIEKSRTPEFHIAFVGAIKAGKSTLINALLGKQLASTSVTPETAVLTKFRAAKDNNYVKLSFYNSHEWETLWKSVHDSKSTLFLEEYNKLQADSEKGKWIGQADKTIAFDSEESLKAEIEKWTSSKQATHYFVKEVEVGLTDFGLPEQVVFVDTPGLDDAVRYRSDVTRRYIDRANAVFACVKSDAMTGQELATLYRVFSNTRYNPEKVYVIGTQWDTLNRPDENWKQQKAEWTKYLKQDDCYGNEILAEKNVFAVASYLYNLVTNYENLDDDSMFEIESTALKFRIRDIEANLDKLKELSNIDFLKHILSTEIISKYQDILFEDLEQSYLDIKQDIQTFFEDVRKNNIQLLDAANSDIDQIQREREKSKQNLEEVQQQRESLVNTLNLVRRSTEKRVDELCDQIKKLATR